MPLIKNNSIDQDLLRKSIKVINGQIGRVLVPSGRLSLKLAFKESKIEKLVKDATDEFNKAAGCVKSLSVVDNSVILEIDPVHYKLNNVTGAWDELTSRGAGVFSNYVNVEDMDSINIFSFHVGQEIKNLLLAKKFFRDNKIVPTCFISVESAKKVFKGYDSPSDLAVKVSICLTQI